MGSTLCNVISLDVWGHQPGGPDCDCAHAHRAFDEGQDGAIRDADERNEANADRCEGYSVNARYPAGQLDVGDLQSEDATLVRRILQTMVEDGYLSREALNEGCVHVDDSSWPTLTIEDGETGQPLFDVEVVRELGEEWS